MPEGVDFAVEQDCNVMVTPLMKGDEEVADLKQKFDTAVANHPEVPQPQIMVLRHTYAHSPDDPDGWRPAAAAISRFYRTFGATRPLPSTDSSNSARSRNSPNGPNSTSTADR